MKIIEHMTEMKQTTKVEVDDRSYIRKALIRGDKQIIDWFLINDGGSLDQIWEMKLYDKLEAEFGRIMLRKKQ